MALIELSVVIPTYNRSEQLRRCLLGLTRQKLVPHSGFEVIVVVDGSVDDTCQMLGQFTMPYALTVIAQENRGQHVARNRGADAARGRYLLFLDDDVIPSPALVSEHLSVHRSQRGVVGIGQLLMTIPPSADWFTQRFAEGWKQHYDELGRAAAPAWTDCYGANLSVERDKFLAVNGFAEDVRRSHDVELGYRLMKAGAVFVYVHGAVGHLHEAKGVDDLARDYQAAGAAYVQLVRRHPPMLPSLVAPLAEANLRERLLRVLVYWLRVPARCLSWLGKCQPTPTWGRKWFRFLRNYFYWSGVRSAVRDRETWTRLMHGTPILMYHAFTRDRAGSRYIMPVHRFARQMLWLRRLDYRVISLQELLRAWREYGLPPARSVVITIDDGYADIEHAAPLLEHYRYPATLFIVSGRVGAVNTWSNGDGLHGRRLLSWQELAGLRGRGIEYGAHTETHPNLSSLPPGELRQEVTVAKRQLEHRLGTPARTFAYPYGQRDASSERIVEESGFWGACGVEEGLNTSATNVYALHRVEISGTLPLWRFILAVLTGETHLRIR